MGKAAVARMSDRRSTQKYRTKKVEQNLNPEWGESFYFDIWSKDAVLYCDVYDADYASDDYLGQAKLTLHDYCQGGMEEERVAAVRPLYHLRSVIFYATEQM